MRRRPDTGVGTPIASLIDVVFLLIIFFVVTAAIEKDVVDETIKLAQAKHVPAVEEKELNTVTINVTKNGTVNIALQTMSLNTLTSILRATRERSGNSVPIIIRSDGQTYYRDVDKVMEAVGNANLYRVKLSAEVTGK
ncbi:MAG: biopolymer transporter ExbD [Lentisphaeria bacterium]|nr:biopolymer transporter ExbD [Lentisphaeria bacterium]